MKLKNIFKKSSVKTVKPITQKLNSKQLEKVIGGAEETGGRNLSIPLAAGPSGTTGK